MKNITINNLYLHNLKGINVTIPETSVRCSDRGERFR